MMMVVKKKQLVVAALAVIIGTAGYLNAGKSKAGEMEKVNYMGEAQLVDSAVTEESSRDFFARARVDREAGRSRSIETFNSIIMNENADETAKASAQQGVLQLAKNTEIESAVENILRVRGFEDAVCYINNDMANVVVK